MNGSNSVESLSAPIPGPVSVTVIRNRPSALELVPSFTVPVFVYFTALATQILQDQTNQIFVAERLDRRRIGKLQFNPLGFGLMIELHIQFLKERGNLDHAVFRLNFSLAKSLGMQKNGPSC